MATRICLVRDWVLATDGELTVTAATAATGVLRTNAATTFSKLAAAGVITQVRSDGKEKVYSKTPPPRRCAACAGAAAHFFTGPKGQVGLCEAHLTRVYS